MAATQNARELLNRVIARLHPSPGEEAAADTLFATVKERLRLGDFGDLQLEPSNFVATGSYMRNTSISPLNDVDMFLVFKSKGGQLPDAKKVLLLLHKVVQQKFQGCSCRLQRRSVNLVLPLDEQKLSFDVVPAFFESSSGVYKIPNYSRDTESASWITSSPSDAVANLQSAREVRFPLE